MEMNGEHARIRRFGPGRILEHLGLMGIFAVLVVTGLSQKFYMLEISRWFILRAGGIDTVRVIHHYAGYLFTAFMALHIGIAISGILFRHWRPVMVITKKDVTDAVHNIKFYLGIEDRPARCGRYTYKQKFEYWNMLLGGLLMIGSGLVLLFPTFVVRILPGDVIPAAKILHTNEALLVILIIAVWHIYNAIFSPEVFPCDTSIFTGRISRERMLREHPLELEREPAEPLPADVPAGAVAPDDGRP